MRKKIFSSIICSSIILTVQAQLNQDSIAFHQSFIDQGAITQEHTNSNLRSTSTTNSGSFTIGGNNQTYYPVAFKDVGWDSNKVTVLELGRSNLHGDSRGNGALMATFKFHVTRWGHKANFIDADIKQFSWSGVDLIGGWEDITGNSNERYVIIWLKGASTYKFYSNYPQDPLFNNGSLTIDGATYGVKTTRDHYVNPSGLTLAENIWSLGNKSNYFKGNIGIGTTTPAYNLDVNGSMRAQSIVLPLSKTITATENDKFTYKEMDMGHYALGWFYKSSSTPNGAPLWLSGYGGMDFFTRGQHRMSIGFNGNVGIGTDKLDSDYKLVVAGKIAAQEIKIDITAGADFVFEPDYDLKPLSEVEDFIKENKHLPEIPSEKQMQEEGLSVNEFQIKLLQKIEELTLYVIEQDKKIKSLENQLSKE